MCYIFHSFRLFTFQTPYRVYEHILCLNLCWNPLDSTGLPSLALNKIRVAHTILTRSRLKLSTSNSNGQKKFNKFTSLLASKKRVNNPHYPQYHKMFQKLFSNRMQTILQPHTILKHSRNYKSKTLITFGEKPHTPSPKNNKHKNNREKLKIQQNQKTHKIK